jgi:hypothetical protein
MIDKYFNISDIINSIRFYLMLSIVCRQRDDFVGDPEEQLNSYLKLVKDKLLYKQDRILAYVKAASDTMPSAFTKHFGFETTIKR